LCSRPARQGNAVGREELARERFHWSWVADANASPPAGIEGVGLSDRGALSHGKILFGALGFGALKLGLHRACIARLFEQNDLVLDAEEIYGIAKGMVGGVITHRPLEEFLNDLASGAPTPGGGSAAPSSAPWARRCCPWSATSPSAKKGTKRLSPT